MSIIARSNPEAVHARRWAILAVLALSLVVIGLDNTVLNVAIPTLQRTFDASAAELQWMVDAYVLVFAGLLLTMGALGDRFGRARALQVGLVLFGAASIAGALSTEASHVIAARAVMGIGGALIMPSTLSIISNVFAREERGKAIAIWAGVSGLGIGLGPIVGGALIENFSWTAVFLLNVPVVLIALIAGGLLVPESRDPSKPPLDFAGAALSIGAVGALVYGIIEAPSAGWTDALTLVAFGLAVLLGVAFAVREVRTSAPMLDLALLRRPRFSAGAAAIAVTFFAMFAMIFGLTQYFQFVLGKSAFEAGVLMLALALGIPIGANLSVRLVARFGTRTVLMGAMALVAAGLLLVSTWDAATPDWVIGLTLFGLAVSIANVMAPSTEAVMGAVPEEKAGVGSATNDLVRQLGGALGVAIVGSLMNTVYRDRMADAVVGLPPHFAELARDSVGPATAIAGGIGGAAGEALATAAQSAFIEALTTAAPVTAGVVLVSAVVIRRFMPARAEAESELAAGARSSAPTSQEAAYG